MALYTGGWSKYNRPPVNRFIKFKKQTYNYSKGGLMTLQDGSNQSGTVESFTYNLQNQLTGYQSNKTTASYAYGANGLRKSKTVGNVTTKFVWDIRINPYRNLIIFY